MNLAPLPYDLTLMADAAEAITAGFNLAGFTGVRGMCWFHVVKNLKRYFPRNKETAAMLRFDIEKLQISPRPEVFKVAFKLFIEKYMKLSEEKEERDKQEMLEFLEYFELQWFNTQPNWFEGYNHPNNVASASTNNGNESQNALIKREHTLRKLLNLPTFVVVIARMVRNWSYAMSPTNINRKIFHHEPNLLDGNRPFEKGQLELWTKSGG